MLKFVCEHYNGFDTVKKIIYLKNWLFNLLKNFAIICISIILLSLLWVWLLLGLLNLKALNIIF